MNIKITLLGGGNMARSIVAGLVGQGHDPSLITVVDRNPEKRECLAADYGVHASADLPGGVKGAEVVILAIKPKGLGELVGQLGLAIQAGKPLVISIMSGIRLGQLESVFPGVQVIRAMPNTPTRVNAGMTLLCSGERVSEYNLTLAQDIFSSLGLTHKTLSEREFEQLTALTGCGPAFVFYLVDAFTKAMQRIDPSIDAMPLTIQTFAGAMALMKEERLSPDTLIAQVAPKGGMTEQAMQVLSAAPLEEIMKATFEAAIARGDELAK